MPIPAVTQEKIVEALSNFDSSLRTSDVWKNWENNKAQTWVLTHNGQRYPPKKIISMAAEVSVNAFSGGPESNKYLSDRGFVVEPLRTTDLGEILNLILERYSRFRSTEKFGGHHEIKELFTQARLRLESFPVTGNKKHLHVVSSYGKGNWATVPWISVLDDRETKSTQQGTYVVYLFREDGKGCYVKLGQGVTSVIKEFGAGAQQELARRAVDLHRFCGDLKEAGFDMSGRTELDAGRHKLAELYEASTVAFKYYELHAMPSEQQMLADLTALLGVYEKYVESKDGLTPAANDQRQLSLIGTARDFMVEMPNRQKHIREKGAWASWWSFPIKSEAGTRLKPPFYLYAYTGNQKIEGRYRIDDLQTSTGQLGIKSPWPSQTESDLLGRTKAGDKQPDVFKTWFKVGAIEVLDPPKTVADFELAIGLSTPSNVLNQNSFGYVIAEEVPDVKTLKLHKYVPEPLGLQWLIDRTGLDKEVLSGMVEAILGPSPQIMLAGPPGTSKTWLARQLALFLTRDRTEQVRFVQFHPSYSYESFLEGLRPTTNAGGISFERQDGVVLELVNQIRAKGEAENGDEFVLVIDEANRANLPRVLGELMFLFEYRDEAIRLQYSEQFSLPKNLRFIATMNTADRSIRSVDVALRRRFDVFELLPDANILRRHFNTDGNVCHFVGLVEGLEDLNLELEKALDRHHTIGHAFFMRKDLTAKDLRHLWRRKIFPLIEEFFFDQPELTKEFSIERFWPNATNGD